MNLEEFCYGCDRAVFKATEAALDFHAKLRARWGKNNKNKTSIKTKKEIYI